MDVGSLRCFPFLSSQPGIPIREYPEEQAREEWVNGSHEQTTKYAKQDE
jgi:hypothetical protein